MKQIKAVEQEALTSKKNLTHQIDSLTKEFHDLELKHKAAIHDFDTNLYSVTQQFNESQVIR